MKTLLIPFLLVLMAVAEAYLAQLMPVLPATIVFIVALATLFMSAVLYVLISVAKLIRTLDKIS